jgi:hypothetical protein
MPQCTAASLNIACLRGYNLSRLQRLAWEVWFLANELAQNGGTNYLTGLAKPSTPGGVYLLNDATQLFKNWNRDEMQMAELAIYYNNAKAVGANVSTTPAVTQAAIPRTLHVDEDRLIWMKTLLLCQLGAHRKPPL